jgi:hypothetical protein
MQHNLQRSPGFGSQSEQTQLPNLQAFMQQQQMQAAAAAAAASGNAFVTTEVTRAHCGAIPC